MTVQDVLVELDIIVEHLKQVSAHVKILEARLGRIDTLLQRRDHSTALAAVRTNEHVGGEQGPSNCEPAELEARIWTDQEVYHSPGGRDESRSKTSVLSTGGVAKKHVYFGRAAQQTYQKGQAVVSSSEGKDLSLRGGWGDGDAEAILYDKLALFHHLYEANGYCKHGEGQAANYKELKPPDVRPGRTSTPRVSAKLVRNVSCFEVNKASFRHDKVSTPIFGVPSTPNRRVPSSFDANSAPFATYSNQSSPFLRLGRNSINSGGAPSILTSLHLGS